ncbi:T9SS type A sorting domain-containing protein [Fluviicola sp.]|uniref:T9SS type A sorting domain-containing protein n=1 Tax=Fluviicola sp. TaxID=1917219 RepID=UPI00262FEC1D|nr:T9SS type A sorting domain-containing protein [Fluviicola sp.]
MKNCLLLLFLLFSLTGFSQFGPAQMIDNSAASMGIKRIITADLNNDNLNEVIIAQAFNVNQIAYYSSDGNGFFSAKTTIDPDASYPVSIVSGDLNGDQLVDLASVAQTNGQVFIYLNNGNGNFIKQEVDSGIFFLNEIVMQDFDHNGSQDMAVIGQHSIDFYRNNGSALFTKEAILTTQTSPNVLECIYLEAADMNNDDHTDLITAETIGGVIYYNDGTGHFTPQTFTSEVFISTLVHVVDINNDSFKDLIIQHSTGDVKLYTNNGDETFQLEGTLFNSAAIRSMQSIDADADGFQDLYMAYSNKVRVLYNQGNETFGGEQFLYENNSQMVNEVAIGNLDFNPAPEFIWSAVGGTIAYHKSTILSLSENSENSLSIYPNPATSFVSITSDQEIVQITICNSMGQLISSEKGIFKGTMDISGFPSGNYIFEVSTWNGTSRKRITKL